MGAGVIAINRFGYVSSAISVYVFTGDELLRMERSRQKYVTKGRRRVSQEVSFSGSNSRLISKAKYKNEVCPKDADRYFIGGDIDRININTEMEKSLSDMVADERNKQITKCNERYKLPFWIRIKELFVALFFPRNTLLDTIVFYVERTDKEGIENVDSFRKIFEDTGHSVCVKYSEIDWYHFIRQQRPVLAHSISSVQTNPVVNCDVKVAVFDFDDSCKVAQTALCFCNLTLGWLSCCHSFRSSRDFYVRYYEKLVRGERPLEAYYKIAKEVQMTPKVFVQNGVGQDWILFPNLKKKVEKYR